MGIQGWCPEVWHGTVGKKMKIWFWLLEAICIIHPKRFNQKPLLSSILDNGHSVNMRSPLRLWRDSAEAQVVTADSKLCRMGTDEWKHLPCFADICRSSTELVPLCSLPCPSTNELDSNLYSTTVTLFHCVIYFLANPHCEYYRSAGNWIKWIKTWLCKNDIRDVEFVKFGSG